MSTLTYEYVKAKAAEHEGGGARRRAPRWSSIAAIGLAALALFTGVALASPGGDPDPTFDGDGELVVSFGGIDHAYEALVQPDGKLVLVGYGGPDADFAIARLNRDGSLDESFDGDGRAFADFGGNDRALAAALQPDGRIVVAGYRETAQNVREGAVARFDPDGSLDESFDPGGADGDGMKLYPNERFEIEAVLVQPDARIVLAGSLPGTQNQDFAVRRLKPNGEADGTTFAPGDFGGDEWAHAAALQPDGRILLAGDAGGDFAVARYEPGGSLDASFGDGGKRTFGSPDYDSVRDVLVQPDGRIVAAGGGGAGYDFQVARLNPDATPDGTFGAQGIATIPFDESSAAYAAVVQPDGKLVIAGGAVAGGGVELALARIQTDGSLDATFGAGGKTIVPIGSASVATAAALQPDGAVVAAGATLTNDNFAVVRLQADPPPPTGGDPGGDEPSSLPRCGGKRATIVGTARGDKLRGTRRADVIAALGGRDVIRGLGRNDLVCAGTGNDLVVGGPGRDTLRGEAGRDRLLGGPGRDRLVGGPGRDRVKQ